MNNCVYVVISDNVIEGIFKSEEEAKIAAHSVHDESSDKAYNIYEYELDKLEGGEIVKNYLN